MFFRLCLALALLASACSQQPKPAETKVAEKSNLPDTPAGRTFKAWLDAFNSGDRATVETYCRKYEPTKSVDDEMQFRGMTGGFESLQVLKSETNRIEVLVKERHSETRAIANLSVKDGDVAQVDDF